MKAKEAPEKIYIEVTSDGTRYYRDVVKEERTENTDIEYIRADAFVEKAWNWIEDNMLSSNQQDKSRFYYEQFINYMKG